MAAQSDESKRLKTNPVQTEDDGRPGICNIAVVGFGLSAKVFHIPFILALPQYFKLYGIVQRSPTSENDASKAYPEAKVWRSVDEAYQDENVDVVVLTTIPQTHFDLSKAALEASKHVVVEKPFVPTVAEAETLIRIAKANHKLLTVFQNRRWDADFVTLQGLLNSGVLGDVAEFETHFDRHRPDPPPDSWKTADAAGNGATYDLGTHLIDQVFHLFGKPEKVTGFIGNQRRGVKGGAEDSFTILLHYNGMLVTCKAGVVSPEETQLRYWVRGTKGSFKKFHLDPQENQLRNQKMQTSDAGFAIEPISHHGTLSTLAFDGSIASTVCKTVTPPPTYVEFYRTFADALRNGANVPVRAEDARDVLKIIELAKRSSDEGCTLPTDNTLWMSESGL